MTTSEQLEVTFDSVSNRKMWFASVWAGTDLADIPLLSDGISADSDAFPWGDGSAVVEQSSYTTTVNLDSAASCSASASYSLYIAGFAEFGDPCVPSTGNFQWNSDEPVWAQDVNNFQASADETYTYISIPIRCNCVPDNRRRLEEAPLLLPNGVSAGAGQQLDENCQEAFAFHGGRVSHGFQGLGLNNRELHSQFAWGWSNGPLVSSHYGYSLDMIPHVASSNLLVRGRSLGKVKVQYEGNEAKLVVVAGKNMWLKESHAYVGTAPLPHINNNATESSLETIDPFDFPLAESSMRTAKESTHSLIAMDLVDGPVYVIAHATICGDFVAHEEIISSGRARSGRLRRRS